MKAFHRHVLAAHLAIALPALGSGAGCSLIGSPGLTPEGLPHAGVGPFRDVITAESGLSRPGAPVLLRTVAAERAMQADLHLFYAGASIGTPMMLDAGTADAGDGDAGAPRDAGTMDAGVPAVSDDIDWSLFDETRRIFRSPPRADNWGYEPGAVALAPEGGPAWEGGYVTDPWAITVPDGALLYYAAEGGIGVARASAIDGTFSRVGTAPIFGTSATGTPRCPSVVRTEGLSIPEPFFMVYELGGEVRTAVSTDGVTFTDRGAITIQPIALRDVRDGNQVSVGCPGAAVASPTTGRRILRIYYESRRDNGASLVGLVATVDGVTYESHPTPVLTGYDRRMPAPRVINSRLSVLFHWIPRAERGVSIGELRMGVAPGGAELPGGTF